MQKKISRTNVQRILDELPDLLANNVIDAPTSRRIADYYEAQLGRAPAKQSYFLLVLVVLGALLVSGGVILLFAHNWDMLPKWFRVSAAFVPVMIGAACGVWTILGEKDARWREFSAFFTAAGFAVLIALISQIYHTGGTFADYMRLVVLLALPLTYLFQSQSLTVAYSLGLFSFYDMPVLHHTCYLFAILPFYAWFLFRGPYGGKTICARYAVLIPMLNLFFFFLYRGDDLMMSAIATTSMLFAAGLVYRDRGERGWRNPWLAFGWLFFTILLSIGSASRYFWRDVNADVPAFGFWILPLAVGWGLALWRWTPVKIAVMSFPFVALFSYWGILDSYAMFWFTNGYFAVFALTMLFYGIKKQNLTEINGGMLQLALLFSFRFFDARISIIGRAVTFILIGIGFIAMNIWLGRRFKRAADVASVLPAESEAKSDAE